MAEKKKYGVYTDDVEFKDRLEVGNLCKIKLYKSRKEALKKAEDYRKKHNKC